MGEGAVFTHTFMLLTILPGYIYKVSRARVFPVRSRTQLERAGEVRYVMALFST